MNDVKPDQLTCPLHGKPSQRRTCRSCNAAYMRGYQRQRRAANPKVTMLERARERATRSGLEFSLVPDEIEMPEVCPVLGIPIIVGGSRSGNSPSLDRIQPDSGYTAGNVRVISSRANSMKGGRTLSELAALAAKGPPKSREAYALICSVLDWTSGGKRHLYRCSEVRDPGLCRSQRHQHHRMVPGRWERGGREAPRLPDDDGPSVGQEHADQGHHRVLR